MIHDKRLSNLRSIFTSPETYVVNFYTNIMLLLSTVIVLLMPLNAGAFALKVVPSSATSQLGCGATAAWRSPAVVTTTSISRVHMSSNAGREELSRGAWAIRALGAALTGAVTVSKSLAPASADVSVGEGGLPNGARQFSNLLKVQKDWAALGNTVRDKGSTLSMEEWRNIALFLRKVYQVGGDLEFLAGQFPPGKKKEAVELIKSIQKEVEGADAPVRERNVDGFLTAQASVAKKFGVFMEMFNDVPSEL